MARKAKHEHTFDLVVTVTVRSDLDRYPLAKAKRWARNVVLALIDRWDPDSLSVVEVYERKPEVSDAR